MTIKKHFISYCIIILLLLCLQACKKANRSQFNDVAFSDTTSMNVNVPTDSTSDENFNLTEYDTPPTPIQNQMPIYPSKYRSSGIQGVVVLDVEVLNDGTVGEIQVMKSLLSEKGALDDTAVAAVKNWIFKPAMLNKKPVTSHVNIPIPFQLKN